jgi:transposase InsO family protein
VPKSDYYYWHKKWIAGGRTLKSLMDEDKTPTSHTSDPGEELVSIVVQLRLGLMYGENNLSTILSRDYGVKISVHGVHNILSRAKLLEERQKKVHRSRKLSDYEYYPGEVMQLDVKHWKHGGYQYDIIDCCTRIKFKVVFEDYNVNTIVKFLELAIKFYEPAFQMELVQMDNGSEFTNNQIHLEYKKEPPLALPERWLIAHGIGFRHIPPHSPHLNGRIERPHGVDKWRYPRLTTGSHKLKELQEFCEDDCLDYNTYRPHSMLGKMTPLEFLQSLAGFECATIDTSVLHVR